MAPGSPATLRRRRAPWAAPLAALLVVVSAGLAVSAPRAARADTTGTQAAPAAAGWLARQLVDGQRFETVFPPDVFWDQGLTIDAIFAFAAAGVSGTNAGKAIDWLDDPTVADNYYGNFDDDPATATAGAVAKLALAAQVAGKDPSHFAGVDLVALLLTLQAAGTGRFADNGPFGDNANTFDQSLATVALVRTGSHGAEADKAAGYLKSIQCDDGGWPLAMDGVTASPGCDSQVDTTAMVVQALLADHQSAAADDGLDWLVGKQKQDGGFGDESQFAAPENSNSTGLAAEALAAGGRTDTAGRAVAFLTSLQVGCSGESADRGAVAYDASGFNPATAIRATAQAILGLTGVGLADLGTAHASPEAPTLLCDSPTPSTTPTSTPTSSPTATSTATPTSTLTATPTHTSAPGDPTTTAAPVPVAGVGRLPTTGASLTPVLGAAAGAVLVGAGLLVASRIRRRRPQR